MTTRRGFLGAMVAAPMAAPALVKEAINVVNQEIYEHGVNERFASIGSNYRYVGGKFTELPTIHTLKLKIDKSSIREWARSIEMDEGWLIETEHGQIMHCPECDVPNRLKGTTINHEGDAV